MLDAMVEKVLLKKVLVDDGGALNLLFSSALHELGLTAVDLRPSESPF